MTCVHENAVFPFSTCRVLRLNNANTQETVGVLRRGSCYSECNRRESVLEVVNELHQAQFYGFLELCRKEPATHHALHLAKVIASSWIQHQDRKRLAIFMSRLMHA